jgi:hypothetical protein
VLEAVGVLAVTAIGGTPGWLHIGDIPRFGTKDPEERGRVEGSGPLFGIIGLLDNASLLRPVPLQGKNEILKSQRLVLLSLGELK